MDKLNSFSNADTYLVKKQLTFNLNGKAITVITKPGIPDWNTLLPATELLASYSEIVPAGNLLLFGCHHGALCAYLAQELTTGHLSIIEHNSLALEMTRLTLQANLLDDSHDSTRYSFITDLHLPERALGFYDSVMIQLPKGRSLARRWLLQAYMALRTQGSLYLAGANNTGIQSTIKDARDLFGNVTIRAYKKGNRIAQMVKTARNVPLPGWAYAPGIAPGTWIEFSIPINGNVFKIHSLPGVFSWDHLDAGTAMLIEKLDILPGMKVLDVGCGYGILGMVASQAGAASVDLIDSDFLAAASSRENLAINRIQNARVLTGDLLEPVASNKYDLILCNPPFHAGHSVNYLITTSMIEQAYHALNSPGRLLLVANQFIPYDRLIREIFGEVSCLAQSRSYRILSGIK